MSKRLNMHDIVCNSLDKYVYARTYEILFQIKMNARGTLDLLHDIAKIIFWLKRRNRIN